MRQPRPWFECKQHSVVKTLKETKMRSILLHFLFSLTKKSQTSNNILYGVIGLMMIVLNL